MNAKSLLIAGPGEHFAEQVVHCFADEGFTIGLMGRNEQRMNHLSDRLAHIGVKPYVSLADFCDDESVDNAIKDCAQLMPPWACIVYNVKQSHRGGYQDIDLSRVMADMDANVLGGIRVIRAAMNHWQRAEGAAIVLSGGGYKDNPDPQKLSLGLSKGALHTLTLAMQSDTTLSTVAVSEIIIDGEVREQGPLEPSALANVIWNTYSDGIGSIVSLSARA